VKKNSQVRDYVLVAISSSVTMGCYVLTKLYGSDVRVSILYAVAILIFVLSTNNILKLFVIDESIEAKKQRKIEMDDERNILIREKAVYKTNEYMLFLSVIIIYVLSFMNVEFWVICLIGFLVLVQGILSIVLYEYYAKKY
jgi:uncharacterized membrane protein YecN with MAPEG domain